MQAVFDPILAQILSLVRKQIQAVEHNDEIGVKVPHQHTYTKLRHYFWLADLV